MRTRNPGLMLWPLLLTLAMFILVACGTAAAPTAVPPTSESSDAMTPAGEAMADETMTPAGEAMADESMDSSGEAMGDESMDSSGEAMADESMDSSGEAMGDESMDSSGEAMHDDSRSMSDDAMEQAEEKMLVDGWYRDRAVEYYDFGGNSALVNGVVATAPIFVFVHGFDADGSPRFVEGQHNVVDVVPGEDGYSDLWQVMLVTVPEGYQPDSITSKAELDAAGFAVTATEMLVNCPIVPPGTSLEGGEALVQGWHDGEDVYYPDFGLNIPVAIPIWVFITGVDGEGNPQFVEGQSNVIDSVPGDPGYSAFWRVILVTVPEDYQPGSIRSAAGVVAAGLTTTMTDLVVNCPVTLVAEA